jgi:hypothetical protein
VNAAFLTTIAALDALERGPVRQAVEHVDYHADCFRRQCERDPELARIVSLPRATQPNPHDTCADCGGHAWHTDYRNGRAVGLCDECR